jgi:hypothetical protein
MSTAEFEFEKELAAEIANLVRHHVRPLKDRIAELEGRIVDAEKQAAEFRYRGVWQPGETYRKNNFITHDGGVWVCLRETEGKPGQCLDWQLAVRRGRDGKDGKAAA